MIHDIYSSSLQGKSMTDFVNQFSGLRMMKEEGGEFLKLSQDSYLPKYKY